MPRFPIIVCAFLTAATLSAAPPCPVQGLPAGPITGNSIAVQFDTTSTRYIMTTAFRGSAEPPQAYHVGPDTDFQIVFHPPRVATDGILDIAILGTTLTADETLVCSTRLAVPLRAWAPLKGVADRVVIPGVGSASGANGSQWKTSVQLLGFGSGTVYFRPLGTFYGDDRDPHIRYDLGPMNMAAIPGVDLMKDLNAAMGVTGVGNLDIVPDFFDEGTPPYREGYLAPRAEARIYNDSGQGQFGDVVQALTPTQLQRGLLHIIVPPEYPSRSRVNVGLRSFDAAVKIRVGEYIREFDAIAIYDEIELPANTYRQVPLAELYGEVRPGANLLLFTAGQEATFVGYYSVTDNVTNDTKIFTEPDRWHYPRLRDVAIPFAWWY
ncbi:MAG TPA: hypothetical protein VF432_07625 [Thermoanaerobaculia bacterium]